MITRYEIIDEGEVLARFAKTRLRGHGQPLIYGQARLELVRGVDPETLFPAQRYVLREDYEQLQALYDAFQARGV
ncbi:MAG TPA: hypothetical protein HPQ00_00605, partial [Magnetococcales bacterium]|nr:hypothetical protein [Magnetococcales bacterium]